MISWDAVLDFVKLALVVLVLFAMVAAPVVGIIALVDQKSCAVYADINTDYQFHWSFWTGCLVKLPDDYWISTDRVQFINGKLQIAPPSD